ncbi:fourf gag pol protein [Colletotrichum kahawae]|uniref:Fourf gag pol protein n=1 Tax=Colletotrichum kahawae TaxID=34407 RepID=A0AAD9Y8J8_COLKA|nr:fourf gag pol protein [Colletotrichum kahawae]
MNKDRYTYALIYVDDNAIATPNKWCIENIRNDLKKHKYTEAILRRFSYWDLQPVKTPFPSHEELPIRWDKNECTIEEAEEYIEKTSYINWLAQGTRVNIAYHVSKLCQANGGLSQMYLCFVKHLFRYLRGTIHHGIIVGGTDLTRTLALHDSANAYSHVMNPLNQAYTRHIDVRYKWIIEEVLTNKTFSLRLINGFEMTADGLTKSLKA